MEEKPTFREALRFWLKLGCVSFGGPAGQIAVMHAELVEKKKWISEGRFLHALNYCMLLPGPEATQLATYCGWLLHGTRGGIAAGALFVLPAAVLLWALSWGYAAYGAVPWVGAIFYGLKPAVTAIVSVAVIRIGRRALKTGAMWGVAAGAFVALFFLHAPFPLVLAGAGVIGLAGGALRPGWFPSNATDEAAGDGTKPDSRVASGATRPTWCRAAKVVGVSVVVWWTPVVVAAWWQGWNGVLVQQGIFFSKAAMVTFGGAYAVLPYVGQQAVEHYHWLSAPQMLDGLGLAETTPGPLIMVVQFVGFLGGWNQPGSGMLNPLAMATLGAAMTTWTTFVPCFLWIFLGAPHIEQMRGNVRIGRALTTVTASVVGVVLNLAVWFGLHVFFTARGGVDWFAVALAAGAFAAMQRFKIGVVPVVLASGGCGLGWSWMH